MQLNLVIWLRRNGAKQRSIAELSGRSDAWISKLINRPFSETTDEDRELVRKACEQIAGKRVRASELFTKEAA